MSLARKLIAFLFLSSAAMAQTTGAPLNLALPDVHSPNWNIPLNNNFVTINSSYGLLATKNNPVFTGIVTFPITGSTQCLHVNTAGVVSGTGSDCGSGGGAVTSVFGRTGVVTAASGDYSFGLISGSLLVSQLPLFSSGLNGGVPASGGGTVSFLRADGTWAVPPGTGGGAVSSVSNSDGTLTISPTTGAVVASLALSHANTWTATQVFSQITLSAVTGSTQCLHVNSSGDISGTGADCANTTSASLTTNRLPKATGAHALGDSNWSDDGITSTYNGVGPGCLSISTSQLCLTAPPYNASWQGDTTTTTSGTFGVGTSGSVASCATFLANQGVLIVGAGTSGANYIGKVVTCTATTLTVTPTTATSVAGGTVVQHDETAAFLAAFTAIAALPTLTGTIYGPDGIYLVNGPLLDPSGANAILPVPSIASSGANTLVDISIKGFTLPSWNFPGTAGFVISSSINTGNLIGGFSTSTAGNAPNFTNVKLEMENVTLRLPANTGGVAVNATFILAFQGRHMLVYGPGGTGTNPTGGGIFMPGVANEVQQELDDVLSAGFAKDFVITEHTHAGRIYGEFSPNCFVFDNGNTVASVGPYTGNSAQIDYLWTFNCVNGIVGGPGPFRSPINISVADLEEISGNGILDTSNFLYGVINATIPKPAGALTECDANVSGAIHVTVHYLNCQPETTASGGPPSGLIENWLSQEGQGTGLANSGYEFTNPATTNATWATATGFTGKVATYDGATTISNAASATNTAFDGSLPLSACAWINTSIILPASGFAQIVGNSDSSISGNPGFLVDLFNIGATQAIFAYVANNSSTSISTFLGTTPVTPNVTHLVCMVYDGSKSATSVAAYLDGVASAGSQGGPFTGSAASTAPIAIGAQSNGGGSPSQFFTGAIGRVRIVNRLLSASEILGMFNAGPNAY